MKQVLFVAAENAALPGGKVGGIGDVVRDLPLALADQGWSTTVLTPAYGFLHQLPGAKKQQTLAVGFGGTTHTAELYSVAGEDPRVEHRVLEHALLSPHGAGKIYCDDGQDRPFASDAHKYAFFGAAVAAYLVQCAEQQQLPDAVHLHDWHAAFLLMLREFAPQYADLRALRCVYTIHNLALQGIRPLRGDASALESWYPELEYDNLTVADPRYADCVNPMALGIRLAERVNTVSPTYAKEICQADRPTVGFYGGEGLEEDARAAAGQDRLVGILNGCMYPQRRGRRGWKPLADLLADLPEPANTMPAVSAILKRFNRRRPITILTSVGRITAQKVTLFLEPVDGAADNDNPCTALDLILQRLGHDSLFVLLGSGDPMLEQRLADVMRRYDNALFVLGYNENLADQLYSSGDLFLMPSSFEPCGISQMLAMRSGQPCVVHGVGGLRDTVSDGVNGFVFTGATPAAQARAFVNAVDRALNLQAAQPEQWRGIARDAAATRFSWADAARSYIDELYVHSAGERHVVKN